MEGLEHMMEHPAVEITAEVVANQPEDHSEPTEDVDGNPSIIPLPNVEPLTTSSCSAACATDDDRTPEVCLGSGNRLQEKKHVVEHPAVKITAEVVANQPEDHSEPTEDVDGNPSIIPLPNVEPLTTSSCSAACATDDDRTPEVCLGSGNRLQEKKHVVEHPAVKITAEVVANQPEDHSEPTEDVDGNPSIIPLPNVEPLTTSSCSAACATDDDRTPEVCLGSGNRLQEKKHVVEHPAVKITAEVVANQPEDHSEPTEDVDGNPSIIPLPNVEPLTTSSCSAACATDDDRTPEVCLGSGNRLQEKKHVVEHPAVKITAEVVANQPEDHSEPTEDVDGNPSIIPLPNVEPLTTSSCSAACATDDDRTPEVCLGSGNRLQEKKHVVEHPAVKITAEVVANQPEDHSEPTEDVDGNPSIIPLPNVEPLTTSSCSAACATDDDRTPEVCLGSGNRLQEKKHVVEHPAVKITAEVVANQPEDHSEPTEDVDGNPSIIPLPNVEPLTTSSCSAACATDDDRTPEVCLGSGNSEDYYSGQPMKRRRFREVMACASRTQTDDEPKDVSRPKRRRQALKVSVNDRDEPLRKRYGPALKVTINDRNMLRKGKTPVVLLRRLEDQHKDVSRPEHQCKALKISVQDRNMLRKGKTPVVLLRRLEDEHKDVSRPKRQIQALQVTVNDREEVPTCSDRVRRDIICYKCKGNHIPRECPYIITTCYNCGGSQHMAHECWLPVRVSSVRKTTNPHEKREYFK